MHSPVRTATAWRVLGFAFAVQGAVSFVEFGVPVLAPFVEADLALSAFGVGVLVSALNFGRLLSSLPSGQLADGLGERLVLGLGALGVAIFTVTAALGSYGVLLAAVFGMGLFAGSSTPAGSKLVLRAFPRERRGLPMGIRQSAIPLGGLAATVSLPVVAAAHGWRLSLVLASAIPLAGGLVALASRSSGMAPEEGLGSANPLREIARDRNILLAGLWSLLFIAGQYALLTYLALHLTRELGFSLTGAFAVLALSNATGVVGRLAWSWLSDATFGSRREPGLVLVTLSGLAAAALLAAVPAGAPVAVAALGAALAGFSMIGWQGLWVTLVAELAPARAPATAVGFALIFSSVGMVVWPPLLGLAADLGASYRWTWVLLSVLLAMSLIPVLRLQTRARLGQCKS